ncbi:hypothetical protein MJI47_30850, partial [Salmonella enterica subsp. enterica serovar Kentucky]|nr:hypothetical protein [Salmonella enterica subsp. enterica serovar Kentucky]
RSFICWYQMAEAALRPVLDFAICFSTANPSSRRPLANNSCASVKALQDYLTQFSEGDSVSAARAQLSEQQKQLADPAFRARS